MSPLRELAPARLTLLNRTWMIVLRATWRRSGAAPVQDGAACADARRRGVTGRRDAGPTAEDRCTEIKKTARAKGTTIDLICRGDAAVTTEMALRLGRLFGETPEFRLNP
jgi:hypothetical protein